MAKSEAYINHDVLQWAREHARYDVDAAAHKAGVPVERYMQWEEPGEVYPTMRQARLLAKAFNRPLSFFYLESPPEEEELLAEMRRLPGAAPGQESPELARQVHLAVERRLFALEVLNELGERPTPFTMSASLSDDPEVISRYVRGFLNIDFNVHETFKDKPEALRRWRSAFENAGVIVYQVPYVDLSEMRGFAISKNPLPIIAYNSSETDAGRVFTLLHEFGHLLLGETVIHSSSVLFAPEDATKEGFCNRFAAAFLIPEEELLNQPLVIEKGSSATWLDKEVDTLAKLFKVSKGVMIRRLFRFEKVSKASYRTLKKEYDSYRGTKRQGKGGNAHRNRLVHRGRLLSRLAFRGFYDNVLTERDLWAFFNMRPDKLGGIERELFGETYHFQ